MARTCTLDPTAVKLARRRLQAAITAGRDFVLVTRLPVRTTAETGPEVQATYVGTAHIEQMLEDALTLKRSMR